MNHLTIFSILGLLLVSCHTPQVALRKAYRQLPPAERQLADSVLLTALDNEALYTLLDTLKPMSSVQFYQLPLRSAQTQERDSARETILKLQRIANTLSAGDYQFLLQPFERPDSVYRNMEIYVIRKSALQKRVSDAFAFYSKLGITPDAHPATILAVTEYENKYDRWRSYGYLFGYPEYAVDFFIQAGMQQDSTGVFVQRDFFRSPYMRRLPAISPMPFRKGIHLLLLILPCMPKPAERWSGIARCGKNTANRKEYPPSDCG